jgi:hypothetical protein
MGTSKFWPIRLAIINDSSKPEYQPVREKKQQALSGAI